MSFLIDPPWLYANGRAYAALAPERAQGRTAAAAGAATMAVFWGVSISLYLNRPWTRWIWRLCRARDGRDWMLNSGVLRLDQQRGRAGRRTRSARRCSPATRTGSGAAGATGGGRVTEARFPHVAPGKGHYESFYLRAVDPRAPARRLDPPHDAPAPRAGADRLGLVHVLRRRGRAPRTRSSRRCPAPVADPAGLDRDRRQRVRARRRARPRRGARAAPPPGSSRCAATPRRCATSRASGCTARRSRAPSSRARCRARPSTARSRPATARPSSVAGWRGMAGHNWGAEHAATWIWLHGVAFDGRARRVAGPVGRARARRAAADAVDRQRRAAGRRRAHAGSAARGPRA